MTECYEINHAGFIIFLKENMPKINIEYEEANHIITKDYEYWIYDDDVDMTDWLCTMAFVCHLLGNEKSDHLFAEYLEGLEDDSSGS